MPKPESAGRVGLDDIRRQVAFSLSEIASIEATPPPERPQQTEFRLMDLKARVGMMRMLYGAAALPGG